MAELVLFHHAQGLTEGVRAFADELRSAGHLVHVPDLYDGKTFASLDEGMAHGKSIGFDNIRARGREVAEALPPEIVYAGFSMGAMPAQELAQSRPGAKGALILHAAMEPSEFGGPWPAGLPLQIHTMEDDDWGDADIARTIGETVGEAEVFLYPGDRHLFTDNSLSDYDEGATKLVQHRTLSFLERIDLMAAKS